MGVDPPLAVHTSPLISCSRRSFWDRSELTWSSTTSSVLAIPLYKTPSMMQTAPRIKNNVFCIEAASPEGLLEKKWMQRIKEVYWQSWRGEMGATCMAQMITAARDVLCTVVMEICSIYIPREEVHFPTLSGALH